MIKVGNPPYLECSSKGDTRFSAFYARIKGRENKSIEEIYQASKVFKDGSTGLAWRDAKGKKAINQEELAVLYTQLWEEYIEENPDLMNVILEANGLSDMFGQLGRNCQAVSLWYIREKHKENI